MTEDWPESIWQTWDRLRDLANLMTRLKSANRLDGNSLHTAEHALSDARTKIIAAFDTLKQKDK